MALGPPFDRLRAGSPRTPGWRDVSTLAGRCVQFWAGCVHFSAECVQFRGQCVQFFAECVHFGEGRVQFSAEGVRSPQGRRRGTAGPGIGHGRTTAVDVATRRQDRRNSI